MFITAMKIKLNEPAPLFRLFNSEKQLVSLENLKGQNILLLFFPAAFTSTCTQELCSVRDDLVYYNEMKTQVFGISTDSVYSLKKYKQELKLNFELLSDFNKEVSELYGACYELFNYGMKGVSKRAAFVIDQSGLIRYAEVLDNANELPDIKRIRKTVESLR